MKLFSVLFRVVSIIVVIDIISTNKHKNSGSKYDRAYAKCKTGDCSYRSNDEACIMRCISQECYQEIYGDYLLEYGEINYELKNRFESCVNKQKK